MTDIYLINCEVSEYEHNENYNEDIDDNKASEVQSSDREQARDSQDNQALKTIRSF